MSSVPEKNKSKKTYSFVFRTLCDLGLLWFGWAKPGILCKYLSNIMKKVPVNLYTSKSKHSLRYLLDLDPTSNEPFSEFGNHVSVF